VKTLLSTSRLNGLILLAGLLFAAGVPAQNSVVRVGVYQNEPKIMPDSRGQPSGLLGDLLSAIAEQENWQLEPVHCEWERCLSLLAQGEIDLMPDVAVSPARRELFDFHQVPALHSWSQLFSRPDRNIHSPLDLDRKRVAILAEGVQQEYLQQLMDGFDIHPRIMPVGTLREALEEVQLGHVDLAVSNHLYGNYHAAEYGVIPTSIVFQPSQLYYAAPLGQAHEHHARIDYWLERWKADAGSPYYTLMKRWGGETPQALIPPMLVWGLSVSIMLLTLALAFVWLLRRQVQARTRALAANEAHLSDILANIQAFIYHKGTDYRYQYVNTALCTFLGRTPQQLIGARDADFFDPETVQEIHQADRQVIEQGKRVLVEEVITPVDSVQPRVLMTVKMPLWDAKGNVRGLCGVSTDITDQRRHQQQLHQLSHYDPLTGLPNRRQLQERLKLALLAAEPGSQEGAILFIDLDNFRDLNDDQGHEVGDQLLQAVAARLNQLPLEHFMLARFGGDEFVLLLEGLSPFRDRALLQMEHHVKAVLSELQAPFELDQGRRYTGTASVGVAMFSDAPGDIRELIKKAELAMYAAKNAGRSGFSFFDPSMQAQVRLRAELETGMRRALEQDEFRLWYQPQFDADGQLIGMEALVRWQHPEQGMVSPADFIPVAETSGLILPLGRWILRTACEQLVSWREHPVLAGVRIAVNISARQMQDESFVTQVCSILDETGANAGALELELTESLLVQDVEQTIEKMQALRQRGVHFALDDFGTGYSSMSYLKRLPLDKLKIDQSFVRDLMTDPNDAAIIRTIVALGQSLDLAVIAEGVETDAQKQALIASGCRGFQGYLFSRPGSAQELEQSLHTDV
jgi:diguanylate cyclase (GGDEF)-like protein/PAS domain S-box-containing protein